MRRTRVYIAGPYTTGDPVVNTRRVIEAATTLLQRGYAPYVPHLTMFWHLVSPQPYQVWLDHDFEWVRACDYLLRLDGESSGADQEVKVAQAAKITVYWSMDTLLAGTNPTMPGIQTDFYCLACGRPAAECGNPRCRG